MHVATAKVTNLLKKITPLASAEILLSFVVMISLLFQSLYLRGSYLLLTTSLPALAIIYFLSAYKPIPRGTSSLYAVVISKILRISCFITATGLWFMYLSLEGHHEILIVGICCITVCCTLFLLFSLNRIERLRSFRFDMLRGLVLILVSITVLLERNTL